MSRAQRMLQKIKKKQRNNKLKQERIEFELGLTEYDLNSPSLELRPQQISLLLPRVKKASTKEKLIIKHQEIDEQFKLIK